jgi:hypothetical protein
VPQGVLDDVDGDRIDLEVGDLGDLHVLTPSGSGG